MKKQIDQEIQVVYKKKLSRLGARFKIENTRDLLFVTQQPAVKWSIQSEIARGKRTVCDV